MQVNTSPEFKGIKTCPLVFGTVQDKVNTSPEFKGIKTRMQFWFQIFHKSKYQP